MKNADRGSAGELIGEGLRIGIVRARFNEALTESWPKPACPSWNGWTSTPATSSTSTCPVRWRSRWP